jgi:hypothetical protein
MCAAFIVIFGYMRVKYWVLWMKKDKQESDALYAAAHNK